MVDDFSPTKLDTSRLALSYTLLLRYSRAPTVCGLPVAARQTKKRPKQ
jgi:hypothetical protein